MKKCITLLIALIFSVQFLASCQIAPVNQLPSLPVMDSQELSGYVIAYCWTGNDTDVSSTDADRKRVDIVVQSGDGKQYVRIAEKHPNPDNSLVYQLGCMAFDEYGFAEKTNALSWRPNSNVLSTTLYSVLPLKFYFVDISPDFEISKLDHLGTLDLLQITDGHGIYWSPTSQQFATVARGGFNGEYFDENVWVYNFDTKKYKQITFYKLVVADYVTSAIWSPEGDKLAISYGEPNSGIEITNPNDLSNRIEISNKTHKEITPWKYQLGDSVLNTFSSKTSLNIHIYLSSKPVWVNLENQQKVVFVASNQQEKASLFMVDEDGSNLIELLPKTEGLIAMPTLSPDGKTLAFVEYAGWNNNFQVSIKLLNLETMQVTFLINLSKDKDVKTLRVGGLGWTPDGKYLAFASNFDGRSDIYVVRNDGSGWINLTKDYAGEASSPVWKP